jgi:ribose-phosphate pyrophosphokinase
MKPVLVEVNHKIGKSIAKKSGIEYSKLVVEPFPDNESYVKFDCKVKGRKVFLLVDFAKQANTMLTITMLAVNALKRLKAKKVFLIAPYMPYLRQDRAFAKREAISGFTIGKFISELFDGIITIDPHLHRVKNLSGFFSCKTMKLTATNLIADELAKKNVVLVGPDAESKQWIKQIAEKAGKEFVIAIKTRYNSRKVVVKIDKKNVVLKNRNVVIVDDIISSGHTILQANKGLKKEKVNKVGCYCIHGLFMEGALERLKGKGIMPRATNTIPNKVDKIDVSETIAEGVKKWI